MYFLPDEEIEFEWLRHEDGLVREGHCRYENDYCYFNVDDSPTDSDGASVVVYCLFSMSAEALVRELALRKLFELRKKGICSQRTDVTRLLDRKADGAPSGMQFVGRFLYASLNDPASLTLKRSAATDSREDGPVVVAF